MGGRLVNPSFLCLLCFMCLLWHTTKEVLKVTLIA